MPPHSRECRPSCSERRCSRATSRRGVHRASIPSSHFVPNSRQPGESIVKKLAALVAFAFTVVALAPAVQAQAGASFTGKWDGKYILTRPDGTPADPRDITFNLTQKGKVLEGMAGPPSQQTKIEKGAIVAGK